MASFLMIHGAWHGGWCFDRLRAPLEARGHAMAAPTLPGMGGDAKALAAVSLEGWAEFVVDEARKLPAPVILCGHSRGGLVISQAAELAPELFRALVYISTATVLDGQSLYDAIGAAMESDRFGEALSPVADGLGIVFAPDAAIPVFYNRCTPQDQADSAARLIAEPVRPLGTRLHLSEARYHKVPRHYVECTQDRCFPIEVQRSMRAALPFASVVTLESDHSPFVCVPDQLAAALNNLAEERVACPRS
jgi:pimeloyl-ACP methyl ester carboxylesterase